MSIKHWIYATRPKTLPAGAIPVIIGSAFAYRSEIFDAFYFIIILLCSIFIQVLVNFINEIYDFKKGADTKERTGPQRAVAAGFISPKTMTRVSAVLMILTFALGMILVARAGLFILAIGFSALFFAWAYTGGPYPLAYKGLGDLFVLVYFGVAAVCGTFYIFAEYISHEVLIASFAPGIISMNLLSVNNIRDIDTDRKVGKMTLQARLGRKYSVKLQFFLTILLYIIPIYLAIYSNEYFYLLPILSLPLAVKNLRHVRIYDGKNLNIVLANTGKLLLLYGILFSAGIIFA